MKTTELLPEECRKELREKLEHYEKQYNRWGWEGDNHKANVLKWILGERQAP